MNFCNIIFSYSCSRTFLKKLNFRRLSVCNTSSIFYPFSYSRSYLSNDARLDNTQIKKYIESLVQEYKDISEGNELGSLSTRITELKPIYDLHNKKNSLLDCISSLNELNTGETSDVDLKKQIEKEKTEYLEQIQELDEQLLNQLVPGDPHDFHNSIIMEISAGVGGQEAMLFAKELFEMYSNYFSFKGWTIDNYHCEDSDIGGVRHATIFVVGNKAYKYMKHEAGVHRVQRVPATEKSGRVHTSTVSITVLPQPKEVDIKILDKDLKIETKRASGAGGQHVNKTESAVRIVHLPTGLSVECQTDRSQIKNKQEALRKLRAILFKKEIDEQMASTSSTKKMQVKSKVRSEKIRTYNFNQDRITDHRISENIYNLSNFLTGSEMLDYLIERLEENQKQEVLSLKIEEFCSKY